MRRQQFKFHDFDSACIQAMAFAAYYNNGVWVVTHLIDENLYKVIHKSSLNGECILFAAAGADASASAKSYTECRDEAFRKYFNI